VSSIVGAFSTDELGASWVVIVQGQRGVILSSLAHAWSAAGF